MNLRPRKSLLLMLALAGMALPACKVDVEKIHFGKDQCQSCRMTIVDHQHAAQFVTSKGKQYKFDSIECLQDALNHNDYGHIAKMKVTAFGESKMIDAESAFFLVTPKIKSPMGANLSAFPSQQQAQDALKNYGGKLYRWSDLPKYLRSHPQAGVDSPSNEIPPR